MDFDAEVRRLEAAKVADERDRAQAQAREAEPVVVWRAQLVEAATALRTRAVPTIEVYEGKVRQRSKRTGPGGGWPYETVFTGKPRAVDGWPLPLHPEAGECWFDLLLTTDARLRKLAGNVQVSGRWRAREVTRISELETRVCSDGHPARVEIPYYDSDTGQPGCSAAGSEWLLAAVGRTIHHATTRAGTLGRPWT